MYISTYRVYSVLKDLCNKDQRGFITPDVFNSFAPIAQNMIFNKMFESVRKKRRQRQGQIDAGYFLSSLKRIKEDLMTFERTVPISFVSGYAAKPSDFAYSISASKADGTPIDIVTDVYKTNFAVRSTLGSPTEAAPLINVSSGFNIFPSTITNCLFSYYKVPAGIDVNGAKVANKPSYSYFTINGVETYNPAATIDFELPEFYMPYLIVEMARMAGVHLRDRDVMMYTQITERDNDIEAQ